jgi:acetolactate synthase-1/2/3 large subunit
MCGDGGFLVNLGELATAREEGLLFTTVLFDDGGYGVLRNLQNAVFDGRKVGVDLKSPDFCELARSFGFQSVRVGDAARFRDALSEAIESDRQWIIIVDVVELGPTPRPFSGTPSLDLYRPK